MKFRHLTLAAALIAGPPAVLAEEADAKPAAEDSAPAAGAWESVETLLKGPAKRPASQEEAKEIYTAWLTELDAAADAFTAAHPDDPHRWQIALQRIQTNQVRAVCDVNPLPPDGLKSLRESILKADDAPAETKATVSLMAVMELQDDDEAFRAAAKAHEEAYPDFAGNRRIASVLARLDTHKALTEDPLDLSFTAVDGTKIDMKDLRGKVVLVDFWATWCGPCIAELPNVVAAYDKLHEKGFEIVGISFESTRVPEGAGDDEAAKAKDAAREKLVTFTADKKMPWPQYFDGQGWQNDIGRRFGINSIPTMWLVDKNGMVVDFNARKDLASKVEKLLGGE